MSLSDITRTVVGVDGCKGGWIAVAIPSGSRPQATVVESFAQIVEAFAEDAVIAVDMPIGLPDDGERGGRIAERTVKRLPNVPKSSVFGIPSRKAVHCERGIYTSQADRMEGYRRALAVARSTSATQTGFSIQAFSIFPRIQQIDQVLIANAALVSRILESHPEVAFRSLAGWKPIGSKKTPEGIERRKEILLDHGFQSGFLDAAPPAGSKADDYLDAACMTVVAARHLKGQTTAHPSPLVHDSHGIPVAIWC